MKRIFKYAVHLVVFIALQLLIAAIAANLIQAEALRVANEYDGPFGLVAWGTIVIAVVAVVTPIVGTLLYWVFTQFTRRFAWLKLRTIAAVVIVFFGSLTLLGSAVVLELAISANEMHTTFQDSIVDTESNNFIAPGFDLKSPTPQELKQDEENKRMQNFTFGVFAALITLLYAFANTVIFLAYEGLFRLARKIKPHLKK
jgi:uncharacterized membrane protein